MNWPLFFKALFAIIMFIYVINNPAEAANFIHMLINWAGAAGKSIIQFIKGVFS